MTKHHAESGITLFFFFFFLEQIHKNKNLDFGKAIRTKPGLLSHRTYEESV